MVKLIAGIFRLIYAVVGSIIATPIIMYGQIKVFSDVKKEKEAEENAVSFFRNLTSDGELAIVGIENLSDHEVKMCYLKVRDELRYIARKRNEKISNTIINALTRDRLIDLVDGNFDEMFQWMSERYKNDGIATTFIMGRAYQ